MPLEHGGADLRVVHEDLLYDLWHLGNFHQCEIHRPGLIDAGNCTSPSHAMTTLGSGIVFLIDSGSRTAYHMLS